MGGGNSGGGVVIIMVDDHQGSSISTWNLVLGLRVLCCHGLIDYLLPLGSID
jgi:hypothetical protein